MMTNSERESKLEAAIVDFAIARGWWQAKFVSPGLRSVPDRILIRNGVHIFIEVKRHNEKARKQQEKRHRDMRKYGATVYLVDTIEQAREILA